MFWIEWAKIGAKVINFKIQFSIPIIAHKFKVERFFLNNNLLQARQKYSTKLLRQHKKSKVTKFRSHMRMSLFIDVSKCLLSFVLETAQTAHCAHFGRA
jgi:hypothetical protein